MKKINVTLEELSVITEMAKEFSYKTGHMPNIVSSYSGTTLMVEAPESWLEHLGF